MTNQPPLGTLRTLLVTTEQGKQHTALYAWSPSGWIWARLPPLLNWLRYVAAADVDDELAKRGMKGQWQEWTQ